MGMKQAKASSSPMALEPDFALIYSCELHRSVEHALLVLGEA